MTVSFVIGSLVAFVVAFVVAFIVAFVLIALVSIVVTFSVEFILVIFVLVPSKALTRVSNLFLNSYLLTYSGFNKSSSKLSNELRLKSVLLVLRR